MSGIGGGGRSDMVEGLKGSSKTPAAMTVKYARPQTYFLFAQGGIGSEDVQEFFLSRYIGVMPKAAVSYFGSRNKDSAAMALRLAKKPGFNPGLYLSRLYNWYLRYANLRFEESLALERIALFENEKIYDRPNPLYLALFPLTKAIFSQALVYVLILPVEALSIVYEAGSAIAQRKPSVFGNKFINSLAVILNKAVVLPDLYGLLNGVFYQTPAFLFERNKDYGRIPRNSKPEAIAARTLNQFGRDFAGKQKLNTKELEKIYADDILAKLFLGTGFGDAPEFANYALYKIRGETNDPDMQDLKGAREFVKGFTVNVADNLDSIFYRLSEINMLLSLYKGLQKQSVTPAATSKTVTFMVDIQKELNNFANLELLTMNSTDFQTKLKKLSGERALNLDKIKRVIAVQKKLRRIFCVEFKLQLKGAQQSLDNSEAPPAPLVFSHSSPDPLPVVRDESSLQQPEHKVDETTSQPHDPGLERLKKRSAVQAAEAGKNKTDFFNA